MDTMRQLNSEHQARQLMRAKTQMPIFFLGALIGAGGIAPGILVFQDSGVTVWSVGLCLCGAVAAIIWWMSAQLLAEWDRAVVLRMGRFHSVRGPGFFMMVARAAGRLAGVDVDNRLLALRLAYILIPIGIFAWIAFSLPTIMVNYGYIISVFSDPLGLGWDLLGTADAHFKPFVPDWIPIIQGAVLLIGLYIGVSRGFMALSDLLPDTSSRIRAMLHPAIFTLLVINLLLKLYLG